MAELPRVEQQLTPQMIRERKIALQVAKNDFEGSNVVLRQVSEFLMQNRFYEREIDAARGKIFMLLVVRVRNMEVTRSADYMLQIGEAADALVKEAKKDPIE